MIVASRWGSSGTAPPSARTEKRKELVSASISQAASHGRFRCTCSIDSRQLSDDWPPPLSLVFGVRVQERPHIAFNPRVKTLQGPLLLIRFGDSHDAQVRRVSCHGQFPQRSAKSPTQKVGAAVYVLIPDRITFSFEPGLLFFDVFAVLWILDARGQGQFFLLRGYLAEAALQRSRGR